MGATPVKDGVQVDAPAPENTLLSFWSALDAGVEGIELDVHISRDGVPMVIHSDDLAEKIPHFYNGPVKGKVSDFVADDLKKFLLPRGQSIPTLHEALGLVVRFNAVASRKVAAPIINIEIKAPEAAAAVHAVVDKYVSRGAISSQQIVFCSFKWEALEELRRGNPHYRVAPMLKTSRIFGEANVSPKTYKVKPDAPVLSRLFVDIAEQRARMPFDAVDCVIQDIRPELVQYCRKAGLGLYASVSSYRPKLGPVPGLVENMTRVASHLNFLALKLDRPERMLAVRRSVAAP